MGGLGTAGVRAQTGKCLGFEDIQSPTFGPEGDKDAEEGKIRRGQEGASHLSCSDHWGPDQVTCSPHPPTMTKCHWGCSCDKMGQDLPSQRQHAEESGVRAQQPLVESSPGQCT